MKGVSRFKKILFFALPVTGVLLAFAPKDEILTRLVQQLGDYTETYAPEKVYLHLDKPQYASGDDVWFKAYAVSAATHLPDSASGVLYVELLNAKGETLLAEKIKMSGGLGNGDLALPDNLPTAHYQLRAYTRWMQNGKPDFFFARTIAIINPNDRIVSPEKAKPAEASVDVQFFPEGGDLVEGLLSMVAFKATDRQGKGVDVQVRVVSDADTSAVFTASHAGMGSFLFKPEAGKNHQALVALPGGKTVSFPLPKPKPQGWAMQVKNTDNRCTITVNSNKNTEEKLYVIAQTRGKAVYQTEGRIVNNTFALAVPTQTFPAGITQITVFDAAGTPQCERLIFVNRNDQANLQLSTDKPAYAPREKVTLTLTARDAQGNPVAGNFSVAVAQGLASGDDTILSNLLLTSDLKGSVENPGFYFQDNNPLAAQALDCLMLTQGWRRFAWAEVTSLREPPFERETDVTLTARLLNENNGQPMPAKILLLSAPGTESVFRYGYTDNAGRIRLSSLDFYDYRNIFIGVYDKELYGTAKVVADSAQAAPGFVAFNAGTAFSEALRQTAQRERFRAVVRRNYVSNESDANLSASADTALRPVSPIYPKADEILKLDDFTLFPTMAEVVRDVVPWGIMTNKKGQAGFRLLNLDNKLYFKRDPLYFIDNVPVHNIDPILALDPATVSSLECIRSGLGRAQFGEIGFNGIFCAFTKSGDFYPANEPGLFSFSVRGFQKARQFYAPAYENAGASRRQPDFRTTLYWNPNVVTDASGRATMTFYNSDDLAAWRVTAEGISMKGQPGTGGLSYEVKMGGVR